MKRQIPRLLLLFLSLCLAACNSSDFVAGQAIQPPGSPPTGVALRPLPNCDGLLQEYVDNWVENLLVKLGLVSRIDYLCLPKQRNPAIQEPRTGSRDNSHISCFGCSTMTYTLAALAIANSTLSSVQPVLQVNLIFSFYSANKRHLTLLF